MDVGFLLFHSHDKLYNCVYLAINSEGNILSHAKETGSYTEGVTGPARQKEQRQPHQDRWGFESALIWVCLGAPA